jgi:hypothetical protein
VTGEGLGAYRVDGGELAWRIAWRGFYLVARRFGWLVRLAAAAGVPSFEDRILRLDLIGRRTGRPRPVLLTLIRLRGAWYVGHPNGPAAWLGNLKAAGVVTATLLGSPPVRLRATLLPVGPERTAVIRATSSEQIIPARPLYWAARGHIMRAGIYARLELEDDEGSSVPVPR